MAGVRRSGRPAVAALGAMALAWSALPGQQTPPGCTPARGIVVDSVRLGAAWPRTRAQHSGRVRPLGRGVYIGVSADTVVSIGVEAPSMAELCGLRVGNTRSEVVRRWGEPRSRLPSAWLYRDTAGVGPRWVAVVYFDTDEVARIAVMIGPGSL